MGHRQQAGSCPAVAWLLIGNIAGKPSASGAVVDGSICAQIPRVVWSYHDLKCLFGGYENEAE